MQRGFVVEPCNDCNNGLIPSSWDDSACPDSIRKNTLYEVLVWLAAIRDETGDFMSFGKLLNKNAENYKTRKNRKTINGEAHEWLRKHFDITPNRYGLEATPARPNCCGNYMCGKQGNYQGSASANYPIVWGSAALEQFEMEGNVGCQKPDSLPKNAHLIRVVPCLPTNAAPLCVVVKITAGGNPIVSGWGEISNAVPRGECVRPRGTVLEPAHACGSGDYRPLQNETGYTEDNVHKSKFMNKTHGCTKFKGGRVFVTSRALRCAGYYAVDKGDEVIRKAVSRLRFELIQERLNMDGQ